MKRYSILTLLISFIGFISLSAKENIPNPNSSNSNFRIIASGCLAATAQTELNINNVRTTILAGGDMWWDLDNGKYEIPKNSGKHSMFAGALWIGGLDDQGNLKVAGMTYRQDGNDFWPGPLNGDPASDDYGTVGADVCSDFDKHFVVTRQEVEDYVGYNNCLADPNCDVANSYSDYSQAQVISDWPASRVDVDGTFEYLAPFEDVNGDGLYSVGIDYPGYDLEGVKDCKTDDVLFGDQTLWWVFNDNGNIHTETGSESAIGLEIQAQAFGFTTNDEINNMTFYSYKIINRSTSVLNETYFGQWVDPDLGNYQDDYVGCDVGLGLGYCYNGDADDDGAAGYNYDSDDPPPAIGVDFFRGPLADLGDGIDNDGDGFIDEPGEQIIMSKFVYYNNDFSDNGNPESATHYYGYLKGIWKNGQPMTYGGTGWESSNPECNFMFPDDTDPEFSATYGPWTEITAGNDPADRRFLQSAGPFTLEPGAVNYITTGVVWARASEGNNFASVELMKIADIKAQTLFDICFEVIDGPSAPDVNFVELDQEIIINLTNSENSNNYATSYSEEDPFISDVLVTSTSSFETEIIGFTYDTLFFEPGSSPNLPENCANPNSCSIFEDLDGDGSNDDLVWSWSSNTGQLIQNPLPIYQDGNIPLDKYYRFEGYQVFQLKDLSVTSNDLYNPDKAFMVFQCDVENYRTAEGQVVSSPSDDTTPISNLVNYQLDESVGPNVYVPQNMTLGASNSGISHSFRITDDKFASGNTKLINNKPYYYMAIAYAYNEYIPYAPEIPFQSLDPVNAYQPSNAGQKNPYLAGRKNIKTYTIIPHKIESFGNVPTASYGSKPSQKGVAGRGNGGNWVELTQECRNNIALNFEMDTLSYKQNFAPADISVIDPLSVPDADFIFATTDFVQSEGYQLSNAKWTLTKIENGDSVTIESSNSLIDNAQQVIPEWGLGVTFKKVYDLESPQVENLGCLTCQTSIPIVSNSDIDELFWDLNLSGQEAIDVGTGSAVLDAISNVWAGIPFDVDDVWQFVPFMRPLDWIRSGSNTYSLNDATLATYHYYGDVSQNGTPINNAGTIMQQNPLDPNGVYEIVSGLVPYKLVSTDKVGKVGESVQDNARNFIDTIGGGFAWDDYKYECSLNTLNNVDLVLTPNKDLWTRCPVIDLSEGTLNWIGSGTPVDASNGTSWSFNTAPSSSNYPWETTNSGAVIVNPNGENGEKKWDLRLDLSVDKDGNPDGTGLGVFNSENGWGWFPGYAVDVSTGKRLNLMFSENSSLGSLNNADDMLFNPTNYIFDYGLADGSAFDEASSVTLGGGHVVYILDTQYQGDNQEDNPHFSSYTGSSANSAWNNLRKKQVIPHIQWVSPILANASSEWLSDEIVIRARVEEPYGYRETSVINGMDSEDGGITFNTTLTNEGFPYYKFNSSEILTILDDARSKEEGLKSVNIVPNPYYGASGYETGQVDNRVKITNLPETCTISIYTINGNLVRQVKKDNEISYFEWDLKNSYGIPIASGVYIIHIDAGEIGEKVLKWFGTLRPVDLDTF